MTFPDSGRLLVVANRLPITARLEQSAIRLVRASGGLASGLRSWHERASAVWIGWPGDVSRFSTTERAELDRQLEKSDLVPVHLSEDEIERYYEGFSNRVLWPLFHYLVDRVPVDASGWTAYRDVNERFADAIVAAYRPGDVVWVHDYQLMLVPELLRARVPDARIGFFLHIPFPSSEVFRILPWRRELLDGLLGADLIGFHTFAYVRHFLTALLHVEGIEAEVDSLQVGERMVKVGAFPMGVDARAFAQLARDPAVVAEAKRIIAEAEGRRLILGIDRLDYTKGIPRRLMAFERLLTRRPELRDRVRFLQIAVPSRERVDSYRSFRRQVDEMVGRINGTCATLRSTPVHYIHRSVPLQQLVALYSAADVMLVTPLRDGMNLVAKEFIAAREDGDGVLVLSEFAGAAAELGDALLVNPYDVEALAASLETALAMPIDERRGRMARLRAHVLRHDVHDWAERFISAVSASAVAQPVSSTPLKIATLVAPTRTEAGRLTLLLDYDGTLVPIADTPEQAAPDPELLQLLQVLCGCKDLDLHLVSGRLRTTLHEWFGAVPLTLWAEHGFWQRPARSDRWATVVSLPEHGWDKVLPIFDHFTRATPGARVERKTASLAWHYRLADPEFGDRQAHELRLLLGDALSNQPLEVIEGKKVIEVRVRGVNKAAVVRQVLASLSDPARVLAVGDDRTDEDMFGTLPAAAISVKVGPGPSSARYRVRHSGEVRELLRALLDRVGEDRAHTRAART